MNLFAPWHALNIPQILRALATSKRGLLESEARKRLTVFGENRHDPPMTIEPLWKVFIREAQRPSVVLLFVIAILLTAFQGWSAHVLILIGAGLLALGANVILRERFEQVRDVLNELRTSSSLVRRIPQPRQKTQIQLRPANTVVPGDILLVGGGDCIPADGRILESTNLEVDEMVLTGESAPQTKRSERLRSATGLLERRNMVFAHSFVTAGTATVAVTATGIATVAGSVARASQTSQETRDWRSPLMNRFIRWSSLVAATGAIAATLVMIATGLPFRTILPSTLTVIAALLPAWPLGIFILLPMEARRRLGAIGTIVKHPATLERLGTIDVICLDKTATITAGTITLECVVDRHFHRLSDRELRHPTAIEHKQLLLAATLCNDATQTITTQKRPLFVGERTDRTIAKGLAHYGYDRSALEERYERLEALPFRPERKMMVVRYHDRNAPLHDIIIVKGAPERVLELGRSTLKKEAARMLETWVNEQTHHGRRVLLVAVGKAARSSMRRTTLARALPPLNILGALVLTDPVKSETSVMLNELRSLGIRPILLSGDHAATTASVCDQLKIGPLPPLTGEMLDAANDRELSEIVTTHSAFARLEPTHKERLIGILQKNGARVAMTGDGINDARALSIADVGIAVACATEIARASSNVLINADTLLSLISLFKEGKQLAETEARLLRLFLASMGMLVGVLLSSWIATGLAILEPLHIFYLTAFVYVLPALTVVYTRIEPPHAHLRRLSLASHCIALVILSMVLGALVTMLPRAIDPSIDISIQRSISWTATATLPLGFLALVPIHWRAMHTLMMGILMIGGVSIIQWLAITDPWLRNVFRVSPLPWQWGLSLIGTTVFIAGTATFHNWFINRRLSALSLHRFLRS